MNGKPQVIRIEKFNIPGHCEGRIKQVLQVKMQYRKPVVWVMMDDKLPYRSIDFYQIGDWVLSGEDENTMDNSAYIGSLKDEEGVIMHCFCIATEPENAPEEDRKDALEDAAAVSTDVETSADDRVSG